MNKNIRPTSKTVRFDLGSPTTSENTTDGIHKREHETNPNPVPDSSSRSDGTDKHNTPNVSTSTCVSISTCATKPVTVHSGSLPPRYDVIMMGPSGVGKTSILNNHTHGFGLLPDYTPTIKDTYLDYDFFIQKKFVQLKIWDTSGSYWDGATYYYYKIASAVVVVYDITRRETHTEVENWLREIYNSTSPNDNTGPLIVLIGNKADLQNERRVAEGEGIMSALKVGGKYFEISAYDSEVIRTIFRTIGEQLLERMGSIDTGEVVDETFPGDAQMDQSRQNRKGTVALYGQAPGDGGRCII